jgi:glycosyltransferase involved in cell wall biosynthesis
MFACRMLQGAAAVHCTAEAELRQAQRYFNGPPGVVIPLVFDLADFEHLPGPELALRTFPQLNVEGLRLLFLSRLHYKKGIEHLLQAARMLLKSAVQCHVFIAGTGDEDYLDRLRTLVRQADLNDHVHFLGFVKDMEKVSLYQACDVFVLPTSQENFGFVLFEALAAGTPVITTRGSDTWSELEASGGAVIIDQDAKQIADAVRSTFLDPAERDRMGEFGRAWTFRNLASGTIVGQYEHLYARAHDEAESGRR